jgi:hypothetical protein
MLTVKKITMASMLVFASIGAQAELVTATQTQQFAGTGGSDSTAPGFDPFTFDKFDSSLGTLTGVFVSYDFSIDGGLIGADNLTNEVVFGSGELGASLLLQSSLPFVDGALNTIFTKVDLSQFAGFTLAADPTASVGGSGPDIATLIGDSLSFNSGLFSLSAFVFNSFVGNSGDTYTVDYDTGSTTLVSVPGAQGFFQSVNAAAELSIYYSYEEPVPEPPVGDVSVPLGAGFAGLAMLGLAGFRRRK